MGRKSRKCKGKSVPLVNLSHAGNAHTHSKLFPLYLCHYKPHFVFLQLIFSEGSEVDVTTNSGTKSSTFFTFESVY